MDSHDLGLLGFLTDEFFLYATNLLVFNVFIKDMYVCDTLKYTHVFLDTVDTIGKFSVNHELSSKNILKAHITIDIVPLFFA